MTTGPTPSTTTARETSVTENQPTDQTPAADPNPGSSRVDVAGLRDEVLAAVCSVRAPMTGDGLFYADDDGTLPIYNEDDTEAALIADAVASVVAARLATAEADAAASRARFTGLVHLAETEATRRLAAESEVERLRAMAVPIADLAQELKLTRENLHQSRAMSDAHFANLQRERRRAEVAERQVQAGLAVLDGHDHADTCGAVLSPGAKYPCSCWKADLTAAIAPLDPDAPTGHDGHGDPDTHRGDTEAACSTCAYLDRLGSMNPSESLRRDIVEVRDRHMAEAHQGDTEAGA